MRCAFTVAAATAIAMCLLPAAAPAHRNVCHIVHACPSDHGTYKWRGLRCVKPDSDKRTPSYTKKVRHGGRTYYCKSK